MPVFFILILSGTALAGISGVPGLFLGAGAVVHATHTRRLDQLGGLAKFMPRTALLFFLGAAAICGLPPLNGFISELLIYRGLLGTLSGGHARGLAGLSALTVPALAATGGLAVACFAKACGTVFLGTARTSRTEHAHEAPATMTGAMAVLAAGCVVIGLFPVLVISPLERAVASWLPAGTPVAVGLAQAAPLRLLCFAGIGLAGVSLLLYGLLIRRFRHAAMAQTWGCGYAAPTPRMQYTASSFAQFLTALFHWVLRSHGRTPAMPELFPPVKQFGRHVDEMVLDRWLLPAARVVERWFSRIRFFQHGQAQSYIPYILIMVLALLAWIMPIGDLLKRLFTR